MRPTRLPALMLCLWLARGASWGAEAPQGERRALVDAMARMRSSRKSGPLTEGLTPDTPIAKRPEGAPMPKDIPGYEPAPGDAVLVTPRRRRRLRHLQLTLDAVPLRMTEDQTSAKPGAFMTVGRRIDTSVSFLPGGQIRENRTESVAALGVFLAQPSVHLYGLRVRVISYTGPKGMQMEGRTPPIGRLDLLAVRDVGDVRGEVVETVEGIVFLLGGQDTVIPLDVAGDLSRRYLAVLSIPTAEGIPSSVNVPASNVGTFAALELDPDKFVPRRREKPTFDAAVSWEFKPDPNAVRPSTQVEGDFLRDIERYLQENPEATQVPLKLVLE